MFITDFVPCHLDTLFIRGKDFTTADGPLVRMAVIGETHDHMDTRGLKSLMPYLGALLLAALEPYSSKNSYQYEPSELIARVMPGLSEEHLNLADKIVTEWHYTCPEGWVLLPKPLLDIVNRVRAEAWQQEIASFKP